MIETLDLSLNPNNPRHLYDLSKALGESLVLNVARDRGRIARLSCVYSGHSDARGFLPSLCRQIVQTKKSGGSTVRVDSSASVTRDYVYVDDVISALTLLATSKQYGIFNVAQGENVSNESIFKALSEAGGVEILANSEARMDKQGAVSIAKMQAAFDWRPRSLFGAVDALLAEVMQ